MYYIYVGSVFAPSTFFFINQITPDSIPCVKYTECCLKVGHQRSVGTRRYHTVSLSADLEHHSPINNPGQIPSLLHLSLLTSSQRTVASGQRTGLPGREHADLGLDEAWCSSGITPWWAAGTISPLPPPSWKHRSIRAGGIPHPPEAHTPQHSIFTCCCTFPQTITFPGSRGFGGGSWLPSPVKNESLLGSGSHSPQAWSASCTSPSTPLLSIDGSPNSTSVSFSRTKTSHKRDLGLEQSFYHRLLIDLYRKQTPSHQDYPRYKDCTGVWVSMLQFAKDLGHHGGIMFWMTLRR